MTFETKGDAEAWLALKHSEIVLGVWSDGGLSSRPLTFAEYADAWLTHRTLKPRTRSHYAAMLTSQLSPTFGKLRAESDHAGYCAPLAYCDGYDDTDPQSDAYGLLRTILASAVQDQLIGVNPCHIRGAGNSRRVHKIKPATLAELDGIVAAIRPERYRLVVLLASWCAMRFGELAELRRGDVDVKNGVIRTRRAVARADGDAIVSTPKSDAGTRDVAIPPHLLPLVKDHLRATVNGKDGLLFPAADGVSHLAPSTLYKSFYRARLAAGRPDLSFHDLRHTGAVLAASTVSPRPLLFARAIVVL